MKRTSYQQGTVTRKPRAKSPDLWVLRYSENGAYRSMEIGTVDKFRTKGSARKEADKKLIEINERLAGIKVSGLCDRFKLESEKGRLGLRPDTASTYLSFMNRVKNEFSDWRIDDFAKNILVVEDWVNALSTKGTPDRVIPDRTAKGKLIPGKTIPGKLPRPASKKTKLHVKAFVHLLLKYAMKWNMLAMQINPATLLEVKGRKKLVRKPNILTRDQWLKLTTDPDLISLVRTMIFIAMLLGLRASEILGLRREDFDLERRVMKIRRSHVGKHTGETKTEASEEEVPLHEDLLIVIEAWLEENTVDGELLLIEGLVDGKVIVGPNGWLFGSLITGRPFWRGTLQQDHLIPAGKKIGIENLGWHDFRHTYRAMMKREKLTLEEQRDLMRHEDIRTTLGYGGESKAEALRGPNARVVEMLRKRA